MEAAVALEKRTGLLLQWGRDRKAPAEAALPSYCLVDVVVIQRKLI